MSGGARLALGVVLVVAAGLRLAGLAAGELWLDEAHTAAVARSSPTAIVEALSHDNHPPLYYLAMHAWVAVVGDSEAAVRLPSALLGLAGVAVASAFARDLAGGRAGIAAALVMGITPLAVHHSREARSYSMLAFAVLAAAWTLHRALTRGGATWWTLHGVAVFVSLATHYVAAPVLLALAVQVKCVGRREHWRPWGTSAGLALAAFAPWLLVARAQMAGVDDSLAWVARFWRSYPPPLAIPLSLRGFLPGGHVPRFVGLPTLPWLQPWLLGLAAVLVALLTAALRGSRLVEPVSRGATLALSAHVLLPLLPPFLASFRHPVYMVGRSDFVAFPAFALLAALAMTRPRQAFGRVAVMAAFVVAATLGLWRELTEPVRALERAPLAAVAARLGDGDVVVFTDLSRPTAEYYLRRANAGAALDLVSYPSEMAHHPAWLNRTPYREREDHLRAEAASVAERVATAVASGRAAVLFFVDQWMNRPLLDALASRGLTFAEHPGAPRYALNRLLIDVRVLVVLRRGLAPEAGGRGALDVAALKQEVEDEHGGALAETTAARRYFQKVTNSVIKPTSKTDRDSYQ